MNKQEKGVFPVVACCIFLFWIFSSPSKTEQSLEMPTDGLIEAMQPLSETLIKPDVHETNFGNLDHNSDEMKDVDTSQSSTSDRHEISKREIIIFTRRNCHPCDQWKQIEQKRFEKAGWTVAYCDRHNYALTPTFLIDANNKQIEHRGYLSFDKIDEVTK